MKVQWGPLASLASSPGASRNGSSETSVLASFPEPPSPEFVDVPPHAENAAATMRRAGIVAIQGRIGAKPSTKRAEVPAWSVSFPHHYPDAANPRESLRLGEHVRGDDNVARTVGSDDGAPNGRSDHRTLP